VVPVALAFVNEPKLRFGADGAVGSFTVIAGDEARLVSVPPDDDFSCACQVCAAAVAGAVAPAPPPAVEPYVMAKVEPPESVRLDTMTVCADTETVPALAVVYPAAEPVVEGALQPLGTTTVTLPLASPPVAAVYVNVIVFAVDEVLTEPVAVVSVPDPSAERTVILGDEPRFVRLPPEVDFCCACHACAPADDGAVAPGPPLAVEP